MHDDLPPQRMHIPDTTIPTRSVAGSESSYSPPVQQSSAASLTQRSYQTLPQSAEPLSKYQADPYRSTSLVQQHASLRGYSMYTGDFGDSTRIRVNLPSGHLAHELNSPPAHHFGLDFPNLDRSGCESDRKSLLSEYRLKPYDSRPADAELSRDSYRALVPSPSPDLSHESEFEADRRVLHVPSGRREPYGPESTDVFQARLELQTKVTFVVRFPIYGMVENWLNVG